MKISQETAKRLLLALESLPDQLLITGKFQDEEGCFCSLGAMIRREKLEYSVHFAETLEDGEYFKIHQKNDSFKGGEEDRWIHMHEWAKSQL